LRCSAFNGVLRSEAACPAVTGASDRSAVAPEFVVGVEADSIPFSRAKNRY
jgi:hypothetical protein